MNTVGRISSYLAGDGSSWNVFWIFFSPPIWEGGGGGAIQSSSWYSMFMNMQRHKEQLEFCRSDNIIKFLKKVQRLDDIYLKGALLHSVGKSLFLTCTGAFRVRQCSISLAPDMKFMETAMLPGLSHYRPLYTAWDVWSVTTSLWTR